MCTVPALALCAVAVFLLRSAAVASVPCTSGDVVSIVTVLVTFPFQLLATLLNGLSALVALGFERAVQAFALLAILVIVPRATAIAPIPIAASCVKQVSA